LTIDKQNDETTGGNTLHNLKEPNMSNAAKLTIADLAKGTRVNVVCDQDTVGIVSCPGTVTRAVKSRNVVDVEFDDGDIIKSVELTDITLRKRGRRTLQETHTADELAEQTSALIARLESTDDQLEKKAIRRALRRRGHAGGLRTLQNDDE
jgi:hypothetical protein